MSSNVKPVVKRAVKPTVKLTVKPTVKPVCLQATHTAQCHNELLNNDGFKIPPAKLNVQCSPRTECTINAKKKKTPKKETQGMYASQTKEPSARISHPPFQKGNEKKTETRNTAARAEEGAEKRNDRPENHRCMLCIISIGSSDGLEQHTGEQVSITLSGLDTKWGISG
jgi:hypothetical protein